MRVIIDFKVNQDDFGRIVIEERDDVAKDFSRRTSSNRTNTMTQLVVAAAVAKVEIDGSITSAERLFEVIKMVVAKDETAFLCRHSIVRRGPENVVRAKIANFFETIAAVVVNIVALNELVGILWSGSRRRIRATVRIVTVSCIASSVGSIKLGQVVDRSEEIDEHARDGKHDDDGGGAFAAETGFLGVSIRRHGSG